MKKKILSLIIASVISQGIVLSAPFDNGIIPQAGTMNTHDMETLKNKMMEDKATKDFKNYKKHRKEKEQLDKQTPKKEKKKVIKAKAEEYATKGVYAENIKVSPSQILTQSEIQAILEEYVGTNVTFDQLQGIVKDLNRLYLKKGFVTARAYIPEQTIEDGVINIELLEGKFGNVNIYDNKWTKKKYIEKQLDIKKGELFDIKLLEEPLKGIADRCNKERIDIAKKARNNWRACNKNSEIAFSGRIDDGLMILMSFSVKIEKESTIKSVLDSIEGNLQIMADFLEENVLKGSKQ